MSRESVTITLTLPAQLNEALRAVAAAEHRSINATIVVALEQFIAVHDRLARCPQTYRPGDH